MHIVTSGHAYLDIDAYAGCIAYAELLNAQGIYAKAASTAPLNESISSTVRSWQAPLHTGYRCLPEDTFTLIDISDPEHFDTFVEPARITGVIDHHTGFEQYWQNRIGDGANIEFIGAACTLVYEAWEDAGLFGSISTTSARLLVCGILDNTLNFGAKVTTDRDKTAYASLILKADLPHDWTAQYFMECQNALIKDLETAIKNDKKIVTFGSFERQICFGQAALWDGKEALSTHQPKIKAVLSSFRQDWFMNVISISERKSYFVTDNKQVQTWLEGLLGVSFEGTVAIADCLWLRKEIIKKDPQS